MHFGDCGARQLCCLHYSGRAQLVRFAHYLVKRQCIVLRGQQMSVTFLQGKGVRARQSAYCVHTVAGPVSRLLPQDGPLFRRPYRALTKTINEVLRGIDPQLSLHGVRRGALEHLAQCGATKEVLMHFSGHAREGTLMRYLRWGQMFARGQEDALPFARQLWSDAGGGMCSGRERSEGHSHNRL